ncbi:MAG: hypothetical protein ACR2IV_24230 [Bryobacteraceae bacterium]
MRLPSLRANSAVARGVTRNSIGVQLCGLVFSLGSVLTSRPCLESTVYGLKPIQCIQELQTGLTHLISSGSKLLGVFDGETDSIDRDPRLVGHFKLSRRRPGLHLSFDNLQKLMHRIRTHKPPPQPSDVFVWTTPWARGSSPPATTKYQVQRALHHEESRCCKQRRNLLRPGNRLVSSEILIACKYRHPDGKHGYSARNEADKSNAPQ